MKKTKNFLLMAFTLGTLTLVIEGCGVDPTEYLKKLFHQAKLKRVTFQINVIYCILMLVILMPYVNKLKF